jgi:hypothetical protein
MARAPRSQPDQRHLLRCSDPFTVWKDGVPVVYSSDREIFEDDPILKTHRHHFEPASDRVLQRTRTETATASPGELRGPVLPPSTETKEDKPDE